MQPATALIFQFTFSGTTTIVAMRVGVSGWVLIDQGTVVATVINAALTVVGAAKDGEVAVLEGAYSVLATLNVPEGVLFRGVGWATIFNYNAGGNCINIAGNNAKVRDLKVVIVAGAGGAGTRPVPIGAANCTMLEIAGCWVVGDKTVADDASSLRQTGIVFNGVTLSKIINCTSEGNKRKGIYLLQSAKNIVSGNSCTLNTSDGIYLYTGSIQNSIVGNNCQTNAACGISIMADENTITGNTITGNTGHGIALSYGAKYCTIVGNTCNGNNQGICVDGTSAVTGFNCITGNTCRLNTVDGIGLTISSNNTVTGNTCQGNSSDGIHVATSINNTVTGNTCQGNTTGNGIYLTTTSINNTVTGNTCQGNTASSGIFISTNSIKNTVSGNTCQGNYNGINLAAGYSTVVGNTCTGNLPGWGIEVNAANCTVSVNTCQGNTLSGIQTFPGADNCTISCNVCNENGRHGIDIQDSDYGIVMGNTCQGNDSGNTGTYDGIYVTGSASYNLVLGNWCKDNDRYGISLSALAVGNVVKDNRFSGNTSGPFYDAGTDTILDTVRLCLVKELGTAAWVVTLGGAMGIDVDAADEGAVGKIKLPTDLQQVVRIKVWATSGVAEADGMRGTFIGSAGIDNEAWNAEAIAVTKTSASLNFAVGDIINWVMSSTDDPDIGDLTASDVLQFCFYYAIAAGADCATDCLIMGDCVEIHYV